MMTTPRHSQFSPSSAALLLRPASALPPSSAARPNGPRLSRRNRINQRSLITNAPRAAVVDPGETVLVAGATGGVGQLVTAKLLEV